MKSLISVLIIGSLAVILFDTAGSLASLNVGFKYQSLIFGSWIIYTVTGFFAARHQGLWVGALAGGVVGLVDATIGWAISGWIGPGRPTTEASALVLIIVIFTVMLIAAAWGLAGGMAGRLFSRRGF